MDFKSAVRDVRCDQLAPVYVCFGPETGLLHEFLELLVSRIAAPGEQDMAVSRYDLSEVPLELVIEDARTPPFIVDRKLIIAQQAYFLSGSKTKSLEQDPGTLIDYVDSPAEFSVLVIVVPADKLDERKKVVKKLKAADALLKLAPMGASELKQWLVNKIDKRGCTIEDAAVDKLLLLAGTDLQRLSTEIEKLSLLAGRGNRITVHTVESIVSRGTEQTIFMLIDEIAEGNADKVFHIFAELLKQREEPIKIASLIARQFRIMLQTKELDRQGVMQREIASQLGLHPFAVKIALKQSRRFSARKLAGILSDLAELDYALKSGKIDKVLGLEMFLLDLLSAPTAARSRP